MNRLEILTENFQRKLKQEGYPVKEIVSNIALAQKRKLSPIRLVRNWTGLSDNAIREGFFNEEKDIISPKINKAILDVLKPWLIAETDQDLPTITIKEVSRKTRLSPQKVIRSLRNYPLSFSINGSTFAAITQQPEFPNKRLGLSDSRDYGLSPKRVVKAARYSSRKPGGGPVQKAGIQSKDINNVIRNKACEEQEIEFKQISQQEKMEEARGQDKDKTVEKIIYSESSAEKILEVLQWFRTVGGKGWITGKETLFAEKLVELTKGQQVDFLIWNCFGFNHIQKKKGEYPFANIINNLDTAITYYFRTRIQEMIEQLAQVGNPQIIILVPTHEVLSDGLGIWKYAQSREDRERMIQATLASFEPIINSISVPYGINPPIVMRWDSYLQQAQADFQDTYTIKGIACMRSLPDSEKRRKRVFQQAAQLFNQYGIVISPSEEVISRQTNYLGMYAGEGIASRGNRIGCRNGVWVNFEEGNVRSSQLIGAKNDLAIVTPSTPQEIEGYYKWKKNVIKNRKKNYE